jgi:hypothetical protein
MPHVWSLFPAASEMTAERQSSLVFSQSAGWFCQADSSVVFGHRLIRHGARFAELKDK